MRASELPSDVLVSVFGKLVDLPNCDIKTWAQQLQLALVCREWRAVAIPIVYRTAVFECQRKNGDPCVRFATPEDTPENTRFTTNLPLLLPYHECTKQLCIRMSTPIDIRYFISFVFGKLEAHGAWPNISLLRARSVAIRTLEDGSSRVVYRELVQMVPRIVRVLPNVSSLQMEAYADDAVVRSFGGRLAAVYAKQLQKFFPAVPMPLKKSCWFTQLTSLNIGFSVRNLQQTLRVSAEHLQNLCMRGIPDTYMWETFDLDQGPIVFRRLIRLALSYDTWAAWQENADGQGKQISILSQLEFPQLQVLRTNHCRNGYLFIAHAQMPPYLERLKIQCGGNQIKVHHLDFSAPVRQYMACLYDEGSNDAGFVQMANYLLESMSAENMTHPHLSYELNHCDIGSLQWANLESLDLTIDCDLSRVVTLLDRLSNLRILTLTLLLFSAEDCVAINTGIHERFGSPRNQINTKVCQLTVWSCEPQKFGNSKAAFIGYLAIRLQTLQSLVVPVTVVAAVRNYILRAGTSYPHTAALQVNSYRHSPVFNPHCF